MSVSDISGIVQTFAIVAGGAFAYSKYLRGRTHYASIQLELETSFHAGVDKTFLAVQATVKNTGTYRMVFNDWSCRRFVRIRSLESQAMGPAETIDACRWDQTSAVTIYLDTVIKDGCDYTDLTLTLEPDEETTATRLIDVTPLRQSPIEVEFEVGCRKQLVGVNFNPKTWTKTKVMVFEHGP